MTAFRQVILACAALLWCCVPDAPAAGGDPATSAFAEVTFADLRRRPMIFFVAKGAPNACGAGCREWIAAEGTIDPDAAQRFRDFLAALPRRDLPVFLNSTGGSAGQSAGLGKILREHRMTAGVGRTIPEGCGNTVPVDDACRRVMQSKREHTARLLTSGARCLSACVYAIVGASVRQVARDAQLGIHSVRIVPLPGRSPTLPAPKVDDIHQLLKRYLVEMGVDPALIDAAAKISHDKIRYMSRDEIARFGIETRGFYESPWMPHEDTWKQSSVLKLITQAKGADGKEYRTSNMRMLCLGAADRIWLGYRRDVATERGRGRNRHPRRGRRQRARAARRRRERCERPAQQHGERGLSSQCDLRAEHRGHRDVHAGGERDGLVARGQALDQRAIEGAE